MSFIILETTTNSTPVSVWAIISALAACVSAFSAFMSRRYAGRSYKLAAKTYEDRQANFDLYLVDSYRWNTNSLPKRKFLLFHITIKNKSDSKSSYKATLDILFSNSDQSTATIVIQHDESHKNAVLNKEISAFTNDIRIEERAMQSKWLIFEQPSDVFIGYKVEKYFVIITDIHGNSKKIESVIIKDSI